MLTRICNFCKTEKPLEELTKNKSSRYGRKKECKKCASERVLLSTDPAKKSEYDKMRRVVSSEKLKDYEKARRALPHRKALAAEASRRRKVRVRNAIPLDFDRDGVMAMYNLAQKIANLTGVKMHVDHIIPLSKGGEHNVGNLQILAAPLNIAKGASTHYQLPHKDYPA